MTGSTVQSGGIPGSSFGRILKLQITGMEEDSQTKREVDLSNLEGRSDS